MLTLNSGKAKILKLKLVITNSHLYLNLTPNIEPFSHRAFLPRFYGTHIDFLMHVVDVLIRSKI